MPTQQRLTTLFFLRLAQCLVDGVKLLVKLERALIAGNHSEFESLKSAFPTAYIMPAVELVPKEVDMLDPEAYLKASADIAKGMQGLLIAQEDLSPTGPFKLRRRFKRIRVDKEADFPLFTAAHSSMMSRHMTKEMYVSLSHVFFTEDAGGWSIAQAIRTGVDIPDSKIGIVLGNVDSYETYSKFLLPMIKEMHGFDASLGTMEEPTDRHQTDMDFEGLGGDDEEEEKEKKKKSEPLREGKMRNLDTLEGILGAYPDLLVAFSITASRNIAGFPMCPAIDRKVSENKMREITFVVREAEVSNYAHYHHTHPS